MRGESSALAYSPPYCVFLAQEERVAALIRLWERAEPSPMRRLFRHAFYARIATHEPDVWALCGTEEQRAKALKDPSSQSGSRPAAVIVQAWSMALKVAFNKLELKQIVGSKNNHEPNGHWTDELKTMS